MKKAPVIVLPGRHAEVRQPQGFVVLQNCNWSLESMMVVLGDDRGGTESRKCNRLLY